IKLCLGSACFSRGNREILRFLEKEASIARQVDLELSACLCRDECGSGPNVIIADCLHEEMTVEKLRRLLKPPVDGEAASSDSF
ncbi:MAG: (2Fe-2S) ferredoxin domain-containing protein, partial [Deltaproteobacteria bacterium]|nr:(2Fe-2S) ferredoxin domain-containing protein [Deltaproteobacteria bacterium]